MASAQELLSAGDPQSALQLLQQQVREKPGDAKLRVFLFQLLSVLGQWERAMAQLDVCGQLDHGTLAMVNTYREAIKCEAVRGAVFAGKTTPVIFGKPAEWVALLVQALSHDAQGHPDQAQQLRAQAFEAAPTTAGSLNGEAFDWIADADSRLGPVLEVVLMGRYPYLGTFEVEGPADFAVARESLAATGTLEFEDRPFDTLSGGEKQRVILAAALAQRREAVADPAHAGGTWAMSLSPRPERFTSTRRPARDAALAVTQATAWADSRAGMIPSVAARRRSAARASASPAVA